jgi:ABC-2 type transport system permease protein
MVSDVKRSRRYDSPLALMKLAGYYARARTRSSLQYRASFAFLLLAQLFSSSIELVSLWAIFHNTKTIGGWGAPQVLWLFAVTNTAFGIADVTVGSIEEIPDHIRTGRFDSYLLRPTPLLVTVLADGFELRRVGRMIPGVVAMLLLFVHPAWFGTSRTFTQMFGAVLAVLIGALIFIATFIAMNSISFWLIDSREVANAFTYGGRAISSYPLDIFSIWLRRLFVWIIPVGFVAWLPGTRLLKVPMATSLPSSLASRVFLPMAPIAAIVSCVMAAMVWRAGVRRYESTGS